MRDDDHAKDTMEAAVHVAGAVRNLRYANAPNRAAVAVAGALEAMAEALLRATLDGGRNKLAVAGTNLVVAQSSMGNTVSSRSCRRMLSSIWRLTTTLIRFALHPWAWRT